jgi:predicted TIM-barrel fold metal-dependent hydrolase
VAAEGPVEELLETYRLMLPGKRVTPVMFGNVLSRRDDEAGNNRYVAQAAARLEFPALLFALPCWSAEALERRVREGGFVGVKVYLTLAESYLPEKEIRIYDYLPPHYLEVLDRHGWLVMLHIPRDGRLRDPVNLAQMLEIEQRYPRAQIIVAHVGRAYCPEDVGNAFEVLAPAERLCFDIAANTNALVFRRALDAVGPRRLLFGSDLPITRMRMRRICEGGNYVNIVPRGLYGDVSADRHMREADGPEAERLTFFLYEEIAAFHRAADEAGLTRGDIEDVFHNNAARLLERARSGATQNV